MYAYLRAKLIEVTEQALIVEVNGIGYSVLFPMSKKSLLPPPLSEVLLYTSYVIRENSQLLYGFLHRQDRDLFEVLLTVSGIGPKTALSLIASCPIATLQKAVINQETRLLVEVPGIGRKTAERLLVELKDKLDFLHSKTDTDSTHPPHYKEAFSALINLGFSAKSAQLALDQVTEKNKDSDLTTLIASALRSQGKKS